MQVGLYKHPFISIFNIHLPMWALGIILLTVFGTENDLADRVGNISVILVAYISFVPSVRKYVPSTDLVTLTDIIIYLNYIACMLTLLHSYLFDKTD